MLLVSGAEAFGALDGDVEEFVDGEGLAGAGAEGGAFDEFHDEEDFGAELDDVVDGGDVGVVQRGGALGFFDEALVVGLLGEPLDGNDTFKGGVLGEVDLAHPADTELFADGEATDGPAGEVGGKWRGGSRLGGVAHYIRGVQNSALQGKGIRRCLRAGLG